MPNYTSTVTMQFRADTTQAKKEMNDLQKQFKELLSSTNLSSGINKGITSELKEAQNAAAALQLALQRATNVKTGSFDLREFDNSIKRSGYSIEELGQQMSRFGVRGTTAFSDLTEQIIRAEQPLRRTSQLLDSVFRTMANSVKWQLSATAVYGVMDAISGAYQYAVDLDSSLNDIRIVSGQSAEQMAAFAEYANQAAKNLSTTTVDYADAALIYYQQGLAEEQVKERTDLTIQMANVTGDTVQEVSDQLTAVWNNFYDGSYSLEYYIDVMTKLGAATASSSSEIAEGLQDFSAIADMIGLSFDYAATAIATTTSVSRQSANVVGTSFRSIFARIQGLMMGEKLEDGVDLNKYSNALAKVGINVLDATGNLRDMNSILDEMGEKWSTLSQTQQTALAQTVAGVWQYNNLVTLMNNWDTFQQNLDIAQNSAGTLEEQSKIYEESWRAASARVKANLEDIYNSILDSDAFKNLLDGVADTINLLDTFIDTIGGLPGVLTLIGSIGTKVFREQLANGIQFAGENLFSLSGKSKEYYDQMRVDALKEVTKQISKEYPTMGNKAWSEIMQQRISTQELLNQKSESLNETQKQYINILKQANIQQQELYQNAADAQDRILSDVQNSFSGLRGMAVANVTDEEWNEKIRSLTDSIYSPGTISRSLENVNKELKTFLNSKDKEKTFSIPINLDENSKKKFQQDLKNLGLQDIIGKTAEEIDKSLLTMSGQYNKFADELEKRFKELPLAGVPGADEAAEKIVEKIRQAGIEFEKTDRARATTEAGFRTIEEALNTLQPTPLDKLSRAAVDFGNVLTGAAISIMTLSSAWDTFNDEDATFFDKLLVTMIALGTTIPTVIEVMNTLKLIKETNIVATLAEIAANIANAKSIDEVTKSKKDESEATEELVKDKGQNAAASVAEDVADGIPNKTKNNKKNNGLDDVADGMKKVGKEASTTKVLIDLLKGAFSNLFGVIKQFTKAGGFLIAGTIAADLISTIYTHATRDNEQYNLDQANTAVTNLTQSYNDLNTELTNFRNDISVYEIAREETNNLVKGTEEYKNKVDEANEAALNLIETYSDIITKDDWELIDGEIIISPESIDKLDQAMEIDVKNAQAASLLATQNQNIATSQNSIADAADEFQDKYTGGESFKNVINSITGSGPTLNTEFKSLVEAAIKDDSILDSKEAIRDNLSIYTQGMSTNFQNELVDALYDAGKEIRELANTVKKDTESRENTYQQNANAELERLGLNDRGLEDVGGRVYTNLVEQITQDTKNNLENEYKNILQEYYGLTKAQSEDATYNKADQIVTYTDEQGNLQELTFAQIEAQVAATEASERFEKTILKVDKEMQSLSQSTNIADQGLLSFLQNGNLEDFNRREYNQVVNEIGYNQKTGKYDKEELDDLLGLTGNAKENKERARQFGYDSANEMREAFIEAMDVEWKFPEWLNDQLQEALTIGSMQTINNKYEELGESAGKSYIEGLNYLFESIDFSQFGDSVVDAQSSLISQLVNIDFTNIESISQFKDVMESFGQEVDLSNEKCRNFLSTMIGFPENIEEITAQITTLRESFSEISEIVGELELGQILTKDDYNTLVAYNEELAQYFTLLADGGAVVTGDPLDIQQELEQGYINDLLNQSEYAKIAAQNWSIAAQYRGQMTTSASELTNGQKELATAQLDLLSVTDQYNEKNKEQIDNWRKTVENGTATQQTYDAIAKKVKDLGINYDEAATYAEEYQNIARNIDYEAALNMDSDEIKAKMDSNEIDKAAGNAALYTQNRQERWEDIDIEEVERYADYIQEIADESDIFSDSMSKNADAAEEVALATIRTNNGMEDLISTFEESSDIMRNSSKESEEYYEAMNNIREALSDVLGVSSDVIDGEFIANNLDLIQSAAEGSEEAIASLKSQLAQDILCKVVGVTDFSQIDQDIQKLFNNVVSLSNELQIGVTANMDDSAFIQAMNELITKTGMTVDEAQGIMNSLGYEPVFDETTAEVPTTITTTQIENIGWHKASIEGNPTLLKLLGLDDGIMLPTLSTSTVSTPGPSYEMTALGYHADEDGNGGSTSKKVQLPGNATAQIKSATRVSSPKYSGSNYSPSNSGGSPAYTPSDSGGGSGGSSGADDKKDEPTPAELMDYTQIVEIVDRYYEITDSLDDMTDALNDASDAADRLYGKDRIAAMEQQRDLMAQQQELLKQYRSEIEVYLAKDKAALENNKYGIHFTFDADGDITNYTQVMTDLYNQLHAAEQTYNLFATKEEQDAYQESTLDPLNKKIEEIQNLISTYTDTTDLLVDVDNQIRDALNEWQDKNYEILTYKVELQIEINDMEQERLDYYLNKYEDDFYKMAESMALTGDSFPLLTNNLATYKDEINKLTDAYNKGEISQDAFIEGMKEVNSGLLENMNALVDLDREMLEYYENTLDSAEDKLDNFTDQLEHQMSILEHYQNVLSLIGKEQDYQMIGSVLQGQFSVAQDQLAAQERWVETLRKQMADIQSDLLSAVDEKEREALNEQLLLVTQRLNEAEESVNDLRESVLELAQSILENDLAKYAQQLSENLVKGLGFGNLDEYLDTIDKLNTSQEEYLTITNKVYETNKLIRQAQEDMAENDSLLAKQRYQEYIDYVEQLQEQGRLSEYELRIAQARYEVLQAQIALEEAQNAKDSMRLVRDSQGNYNYVYTANQDNISQAQQALEDAENNLYNIGLEGAQSYQDKYAQILEEAFNAFKDLSEQYKNGEITSEEEFNQKRLELQNYYYNRLKDIQDLYYIAHDLLVNESYTNEADYLFAGIGNLEDFKDATDQYLQDCNNAFDKWQENTDVATDSVGNGLGDLQDHIQDVTDTSSDLTDQIQDDLIPTLEDELEAVRDMTNLWLSHRDALYETLQAYEKLQQGAQNTISSAAGVQPGGILPNIPEEYQADIGAIMAAYLQQGGSINDDLFQQLWNKRNEKVEWLAAHGYSSSYWGSYGEETIKGFEELVSGGGDQDWYDYAANMYTIEQIREFLKQMGLPAFKSGGYTGEWGPSGRLAIIHEKELILNQDDTNSLINIIRDYGKLKSTNMDVLNLSFNDIITKFKSIINKINLNDQNQVAAQQVSIEASFPNVSVASEIEDAFNDLLNRAAQYASLNRTNY